MRPSREIEFLALVAFSVLPIYGGESPIQIPRVVIFHALLGVLIALIAARKRTVALPTLPLNVIAGAYLLFFLFDLRATLIAASTHMLMFVALWQAVHEETRRKSTQRMLVLCLLYVAAMATSTSMFVVPFSAAFFVLLFRQFIFLEREQTLESIGSERDAGGRPRIASGYILPVAVIAIVIFPMMPRLNSSVLQGVTADLSQSQTTGISESIDFSEMRSISPDDTAVSRIWMPRAAVAFFTPLRLRAEVYDAWEDGRWDRRFENDFEPVEGGPDQYKIALASGLAPEARIEQQVRRDGRLFLPEQTYIVAEVPRLLGSPSRGVYTVWSRGRAARRLEYRVKLGWETGPLEPVPQPELIDYPLSPEVVALASQVTAGAVTTAEKSEAIRRFLLTEFEYLQNPADLGRTVTVDEFLLDVRRGHCEYFAAGMVVMLRAVNVPARIVGGFYGGKLNPLTGYWVVALNDAHAWVEVWDAGRWSVYDPTPPGLRPGTASEGMLRAYATAIADSMTYFWDRYVLSFGGQDQVELVLQLFRSAAAGIAALRGWIQQTRAQPAPLLLVAGLVLAAMAFRFLRRPRVRSLGEQFAEIATRAGVAAAESLTLRELLVRFAERRPELAEEAAEIVAAGERERFAADGLEGPERRRIQRKLSDLRSAT